MPNNSSSVATPDCRLQWQQLLLIILYTLVIFIGVVGNVCILYVFRYRIKQKKTVTEYLILYLAMFDILSSIFGPLIFVYWITTCSRQWHFGYIGCKTLPLLSRIFINISVGIIFILAIDRYRAICHPFKQQLKIKHAHLGVVCTTLLSLLKEVYYVQSLTIYDGRCLVMPADNTVYIIWSSSVIILRDCFLISAFSLTTARTVWTLRERDVIIPTISNAKQNEMRRIVKMIIVMQAVFLILILPRDILLLVFSLSWLDGTGVPYSDIVSANEFLKLFQTANCCANIFVYSKLHDHFRYVVLPGKNRCMSYSVNEANVKNRGRLLSITFKKETDKLDEKGEYRRRILSLIYDINQRESCL